MFTVILSNEFLHGPIWTHKEGADIPGQDFSLLQNDATLISLNDEIGELFDSYYEINSHNQAVWFNEEQLKADKAIWLSLLRRLNTRLNEINDGSFIVKDTLTEYFEKME